MLRDIVYYSKNKINTIPETLFELYIIVKCQWKILKSKRILAKVLLDL